MNRFQLIYNGELGLKNQNCLYIEELKNKYDLIHCENFNDFKNLKGSVTQTLVNHIDVIIHNKDINDLNLFVRRSFSKHLWSWINEP